MASNGCFSVETARAQQRARRAELTAEAGAASPHDFRADQLAYEARSLARLAELTRRTLAKERGLVAQEVGDDMVIRRGVDDGGVAQRGLHVPADAAEREVQDPNEGAEAGALRADLRFERRDPVERLLKIIRSLLHRLSLRHARVAQGRGAAESDQA